MYKSEDRSGTTFLVGKFKDKSGKTFTASGKDIPDNKFLWMILNGEWVNNPKYGKTFSVVSFEFEKPDSRETFLEYITYLRAGTGKQISGRIYDAFGTDSWDIIEQASAETGFGPATQKLCNIRGISTQKVEKLKAKVRTGKIVKDVLTEYASYAEMTPARVHRIVRRFGAQTMDVIEKDTYRILEADNFSFEFVDGLAKLKGVDPDHPLRIRSCIKKTLDDAAVRGHTCLPAPELKKKALALLQVEEKSYDEAFKQAAKDEIIHVAAGYVFTKSRWTSECTLARDLTNLNFTGAVRKVSVKETLEEYEQSNGISLSKRQAEAVQKAFENPVSVITGGPGTGKTTIIKAIVYCYLNALNGAVSDVKLLAPTARAARKMEESSGYAAQTVHSAVDYKGDREEDYDYAAGESIDAKLIVVDEISMLDEFIASVLVSKVTPGTILVLVGDKDQLPSVGAGNVLAEMIRSKKICVTMLDEIFRQKGGSPIIANAKKIREGDKDLEWEKRFKFYLSNGPQNILHDASSLYLKAVQKFGPDDVLLLCPNRDKGELCVEIFNSYIQEKINPLKPGDQYLKAHGVMFRKGDRVMQLKNQEYAKNGDIGVVIDIIFKSGEDPVVKIAFSYTGDVVSYTKEMLEDVTLAYATTVHKAQGGEFKVVIVTESDLHRWAEQRSIAYTAITRAVEYVFFVGDVNVLNRSIVNGNAASKRYTLLGDILYACAERKGERS